jgi:hypothetical protein
LLRQLRLQIGDLRLEALDPLVLLQNEIDQFRVRSAFKFVTVHIRPD